MKINFKEFEKVVNEGKWFDFKTNLGDISLKLKLPEKEMILSTMPKDPRNVSSQYEYMRMKFVENLVGWKGIENQDGKPIPFDKKLFENNLWFNIFYDLNIVYEKEINGNMVPLSKKFMLEVMNILGDSSRFLGDGNPSFLKNT